MCSFFEFLIIAIEKYLIYDKIKEICLEVFYELF